MAWLYFLPIKKARPQMDPETFFDEMPFTDFFGIEVIEIEDGHAEGYVNVRRELSWSNEAVRAHGAVAYALADTLGGAALFSKVKQPVPTIDMRIDYLEAGKGNLRGEADVIRMGDDVGTIESSVYGEDGAHVANGTGVYKIA
jgi:uncharacterized protein (TIGR00369 family)